VVRAERLIAAPPSRVKCTSIRGGERLAERGTPPSVDSVAAGHEDASPSGHRPDAAEPTRTRSRGVARRTIDNLELATLSWVTSTTIRRLQTDLGDVPLVELQAAYPARGAPASTGLESDARAAVQSGSRL
jgi:hypothetical protein